MSIRFFAELGINTFVGAAIFAWIFMPAPLMQHDKGLKTASALGSEQQVGKRSDQIPTVPSTSAGKLAIKIEPAILQTPDQALAPSSSLLEVTATSLNMRSQPTSQSPLINAYSRGARFEQISQNGNWLQVRSTEDGASGWMFGSYLRAVN